MKSFLPGLLALLLPLSALAADDPAPSRVTVNSQPQGATVIIDGIDRGTTPVTLFDLKPGRHHLKYRLAGYEERDRFFDTQTGPYVEKNEVLEEEKGLLLLKTDPADCDIQIDGVSVGRTPRLITHLASKDAYSVVLRKEGYQDQKITVRFQGRTPLVREEKMVLASGQVKISSEPAGAEVTVNGIVRGVTPLVVEGVPKGRAAVKFALEGFAEEVRELSVNAGDEQELAVVLRGLPGTLRVSSVPDGAHVYLNGENRGNAPLVISKLEPGEYVLEAKLYGYSTESKKVVISNGSSASEEFCLTNVMGRLLVRTAPIGATVFLDGRRVGVTHAKDPNATMSDSLLVEDVSEGEHMVTVKMDGYADKLRPVFVENQKTAKSQFTLKRIFTPDVEIETMGGTRYTGVLVGTRTGQIEVEVKEGVIRTFSTDEVREMKHLNEKKGGSKTE